MGKVIKNGDIILTEDDKILGTVVSYDHQGKTYVVAKELDESFVETGHSTNPKQVFEEIVENEDVLLVPVEDKQLADYILANYNK